MSVDALEKAYYDQLIPGQYLDVKYSEYDWKIAKIVDRDRRYASVLFDGFNCRE